MNSGQYVRHIEQLEQSFTNRFLDVDQKNFGKLLKHCVKMLNIPYSQSQLTYIIVNSKKAI
jgi:hypothetical protein